MDTTAHTDKILANLRSYKAHCDEQVEFWHELYFPRMREYRQDGMLVDQGIDLVLEHGPSGAVDRLAQMTDKAMYGNFQEMRKFHTINALIAIISMTKA